MQNALQSYQFDDASVRVVLVQGEPWFVGTDVAAVLGYRSGPDMVRNLDDDEKGTHTVRTLGGEQPLTIISESGLYAAIFKSRREEAQRFRRWVTGEVLPAIRKHGRYELFDPPPSPSALLEDGATERLTAAIGVVREARQIFGPVQARSIWEQVGLPMPISEATADAEADPLVARIGAAVGDKAEVSISDVAGLIGWNPEAVSMSERRRIGEALRLLGWAHRKERVDGVPTNVWRPIPRAIHGKVEG